MVTGSKPRTQRLFRYTAPLHVRQHFLHAHIDKSLREKLKLKRRATSIVKGDTVRIMAGAKRGTTGKVTMVNLRSGRIVIDALKRKNAKGKEQNLSIYASNVYITEFNAEDKLRAQKLGIKVEKAAAPKAETKAEKTEDKPQQAAHAHTHGETAAKM
ncbi:MAG: 50S ribosomal protein L24 [Candidatus Micrarchaeota archaeon]|nr:50S ribosomal protein L24 [Candidatus Micrarchaeota archaeon]